MRLIHFFTDEKFTDFVMYLFDQFAHLEQKYILVKKDKDQKVNFQYNNLEYIVLDDLNSFVANYKPDCIIFHSLFNFNLKVLNELKTDATVCWYSWGGDMALEPIKEFKKVHEPETLAVYHKNTGWKQFKNKILDNVKLNAPNLFNAYHKFRTGEEWNYYTLKKNLPKISVANTVTFAEHDILKRSGFKGKFIHIPIGTIGLLLVGVDIDKKVDHSNRKYPTIFLGHSAYSENNQFDVLKTLKENGFKGQILCGISYGSTDYATELRNYGEALFGEQIIFIDKFLEQNKYFELVQSADYYINNSIIQQGLGNIIAALYIGKTVFINEKGKGYEYLSQMGIKTFSIQKDLKMCNDFFKSKDDITTIRKNIDNVYLEKNVINKLSIFLNELKNEL